jgi:hypothetical protein
MECKTCTPAPNSGQMPLIVGGQVRQFGGPQAEIRSIGRFIRVTALQVLARGGGDLNNAATAALITAAADDKNLVDDAFAKKAAAELTKD